MFALMLLLVGILGLECGVSKERSAPITIGRSQRRLESSRDFFKAPIRFNYFYEDFELDSEEEEDYFRDIVMNAVDSYLSSVLHVYSVVGPLILASEECGDVDVPFDHRSIGLENTDLVVYISTVNKKSESYVAYAGACELESGGLGNVVAGFIVVNKPRFQDKSFENKMMVLIHEMTHLLGFSDALFPYFRNANGELYPEGELYFDAEIRGTVKTLIKSPTVVAKAAEVYGCDSLWGYELESQGGSGTVGSHWDMRVAYNDFMISKMTLDAVYSTITFALLYDSGWYQINWEYTQVPVFGAGEGCAFHTAPCVTDDMANFDEFCTHDEDRCDTLRLYKGFCNLVTHDDSLPEYYQYFENSKKGGADLYADYCPYVDQYANGSCRGNGESETFIDENYGESVCTNCRCLEGNLVKTGDPYFHTGCYEVATCDHSSAVIRIKTSGSDYEEVSCPFTGGSVTVPGFFGVIYCPSSSILCANVPCKNGCYGHGRCVNGICQCESGRTGDDCEIGCHSSCLTCSGPYDHECLTCPGVFSELKEDGTCGCIEGYNLANGECEFTCDDNCYKCDFEDRALCTECYPNMILIEEECYCDEGFKSNKSGKGCSLTGSALLMQIFILFVLI